MKLFTHIFLKITIFLSILFSYSIYALDNTITPTIENSGNIAPELILDSAGNPMYEFIIKESYGSLRCPLDGPIIPVKDLKETDDPYGWHVPVVRCVVRTLEKNYNFKSLYMTSWIEKSFFAHVPTSTYNRLLSSGYIYSAAPVYKNAIESSANWADLQDGNELVPWGKIAVQTLDNKTTNTPIYLVDGYIQDNSELKKSLKPQELNIIATLGKQGNDNQSRQHATHLAGVLGAAKNDYAVRGINPGAPIINARVDLNVGSIKSMLEMIFVDTEQRGIYPVVNISLNGVPFATDRGLKRMLNTLSARALIVQSAGNQAANACNYAYNRGNNANPFDGILVVGGIDEDGKQAVLFDNSENPDYLTKSGGSNAGPCVEVWAPSTNIWSTWYSETQDIAKLSGTSIAAPHVAALAARYGNEKSRPLEREHYILNKRFKSAHNDVNGAEIWIAADKNRSISPTIGRLPVVNVKGSPNSAGNPNALIDGNFLWNIRQTEVMWTAGEQKGWVQFDLGQNRAIHGVRLSAAKAYGQPQGPLHAEGNAVHEIWVGDTEGSMQLVDTIDEVTWDFEPTTKQLEKPVRGRYLKIKTTANPMSFTAWREIEIYGR